MQDSECRRINYDNLQSETKIKVTGKKIFLISFLSFFLMTNVVVN